jgi:hypothetical protein
LALTSFDQSAELAEVLDAPLQFGAQFGSVAAQLRRRHVTPLRQLSLPQRQQLLQPGFLAHCLSP